jgi:3-isopropylmalate dehydrogenase
MREKRDYKIAVIGGDGVGPEVINEGLRVLERVAELTGFSYQLIPYDLGAERYLRTKETLPESILEELKRVDAIYLGALGDPRVEEGILERNILLKLRFSLDLYINLRPVKLYEGVNCPIKEKGPKDIDFVVVRENTECLYVGLGGNFKFGTPQEVALEVALYTRFGIERTVRFAFELAKKRRKKVTLCDKANVLIHGHGLWRRVFKEVAEEYPEITPDYAYVDALCMWLIKNPEWFDVIVTPNMFGDIITDLGAILQGGLGIAAGGNINPQGVSMFEPIHGSAPKYAKLGVINPLAAILALAMLLSQLNEEEGAKRIESAVESVLKKGYLKDLSAGKMGISTSEVGTLVLNHL